MRPDAVEKKITKKTKAIIIVHIYGLPVDVDPIIELSKKYQLKIIEDAAEAHGHRRGQLPPRVQAAPQRREGNEARLQLERFTRPLLRCPDGKRRVQFPVNSSS